MSFLVAFGFGIIATILSQKVLAAISASGGNQINLQTDAIKIQTSGRKVNITGNVELVTVNNQAILTDNTSKTSKKS